MKTQTIEKCGTFGGLNMGEIDQISQALGRLEGKTDAQTLELGHIRGDLSVVKNDTEKLTNSSILSESRISALHLRLDIIEPKVNDHESLKNKGLGIFAFVSMLFGAIGWVVSTFIGKIFP